MNGTHDTEMFQHTCKACGKVVDTNGNYASIGDEFYHLKEPCIDEAAKAFKRWRNPSKEETPSVEQD